MSTSVLAMIAGSVVLYALLSKRVDNWPLTAPMIFVAIGALVSHDGMPGGAMHVDAELLHHVAEFALVFLLFAEASKIDFPALRAEAGLPLRLLGVGLPLTVIAGVIAGRLLFPDWPVSSLIVLAAVLAPTDAALGRAVVENQALPETMRRGLQVEAGLNDGIAVPVVIIAMAAAGATMEGHDAPGATFAVAQIVFGPLIGAAVGGLGGKLMQAAEARDLVAPTFQAIGGLALAVFSFALADLGGGSGYMAAFCGGLAAGYAAPEACRRLQAFVEEDGQLLMVLVFLFVGASAMQQWDDGFRLVHLVFAVIALTLMRMVPTVLSMIGSGLRPITQFYISWFGPRGVASIVLAGLVAQAEGMPHGAEIYSITLVTVLLSVMAHGVTAAPAAKLFARFAAEPAEAGGR